MMFLSLSRQPFLGNQETYKHGLSSKGMEFLFHELSLLHEGDSDEILNRTFNWPTDSLELKSSRSAHEKATVNFFCMDCAHCRERWFHDSEKLFCLSSFARHKQNVWLIGRGDIAFPEPITINNYTLCCLHGDSMKCFLSFYHLNDDQRDISLQ